MGTHVIGLYLNGSAKEVFCWVRNFGSISGCSSALLNKIAIFSWIDTIVLNFIESVVFHFRVLVNTYSVISDIY